jgi:hypothetical protein
MASLQRWITTVISERGDAREREILDQYARWYLLRRLRGRLTRARSGGQRQAGQRHMTEREKDNIRNGVLAAIRLLDLAAGKQLTLAGISQADLDTWAADGKFTYGHCTATFIRWAVAGKHSRPGLKCTTTAPATRTGGRTTPNDGGKTPAGFSTTKPCRCPTGSPGCSYCSTPRTPPTSTA